MSRGYNRLMRCYGVLYHRYDEPLLLQVRFILKYFHVYLPTEKRIRPSGGKGRLSRLRVDVD